jgi:hypothetical protein
MRRLLIFITIVSIWSVVGLESSYAADLKPIEYQLLEPLPLGPGGGQVDKVTASDYIPGVFRLILAMAGVLVVLRIIYAGILYMSTDAYSGKNEAKEIISSSLWGLALTLGAWILVATLFDNKGGALNLNIKIPAQQLPTNDNPPVPGASGGGGVGCRGDCPYSYTNSSGDVIKYKNCVSCSNAQSFGLNIKTGVIDGKQAQINTSLGNKLKNVGTPAFQVTETWPPTVNHSNQLQYDGRSVDVSLNNPNANTISDFIVNAQNSGLTVQYEVRTQAEKDSYVRGGVPASKISVIPRITGEHFSIK